MAHQAHKVLEEMADEDAARDHEAPTATTPAAERSPTRATRYGSST